MCLVRKVTLSKGFADSKSDMGHLVMVIATKHNLATRLLCNVPVSLVEHTAALLLFQLLRMELPQFSKTK